MSTGDPFPENMSAGDSFSEVTHHSWLSRLGQSVSGVIAGILLFIISFPVLFINEGCAVRTAKSLDEGLAIVVSVPADRVDPANQGKLVHVTGEAVPQEQLRDDMFGLRVKGISLARKVEIYQWTEEKKTRREKQLGGGEREVTTYSYKKEWQAKPVNSNDFHDSGRAAHQNRGSLPCPDEKWYASVRLGAFTLAPHQVERIRGQRSMPVTQAIYDQLPEPMREKWKLRDGMFYLPFNPDSATAEPQIGDVRVSYQWVPPGPVSVVARQMNNTFGAYYAKAGSTIDFIDNGIVSAEQMFAEARQANTIRTWLVRFGGFLMMGIGICLVFQPLVVLADVVPLIGNLLNLGVILFAFGTAAVLSLITIAIGWVYYRPVLGITLLVLAGAVLGGLIYLSRSRKQAALSA